MVFLGHVLSKDGISPNPEKVSKVKDWLVLKSAKEVHSFLGLVSYYHRFFPQFAKWANPMHKLIRPIAMKKKHAGVKVPPLAHNLPPFQLTPEHQESFDKLKEALTVAPVLPYPDYSKPFILEIDALLKGLGAVLSQEDDKGNLHVVSYASHTLKPYEKSMKNYGSAQLKLLALKWSVCEKFKDYLIGSKCTILTDNNPLTYIQTSRLGTSQICWLSELTLFNFDIKYHAGKSNQAADALSWQPENSNSSSESSDEEEEWETISYDMVCQILDHHLDSTKLPYNVKYEVQTDIADVEVANVSLGFSQVNLIDVQLNKVKLFDSIFPSQMAEYQKRDTQLSLVYEYMASNHKPKLSKIHHVRSKPIRGLLLQYDWLSLIRGVLHCQTFKDDDEVQQLILSLSLCNKVLQFVHNDNGHQGLQHMLDLLCYKVYWPTMFVDTDHWLSQCKWCLVGKGEYTEPKTLQGSLVAQQPLGLGLLCIDFTKADVAKGGQGEHSCSHRCFL